MLKVENLTVAYNSKKVFDDVSLDFHSGKIYGIIGNNGAGKTTFFNAILNNIDFLGRITIDELSLDQTLICLIETNISFYEYLFPKEWYRMAQNLLHIEEDNCSLVLPVENSKLIKDLSTGNKKKVYINGLFQKQFQIYLLDEPFNALDLAAVVQLKNYIRQISQNSIVIISSNVIEQLMAFCDEIFLIENQQVAKISQLKLKKFI